MNEALQITTIITNVIIAISFVTLIIFVLKLIKWAQDLDSKVDKLTGELSELKDETIPLIHSLKDFVDSVNKISDKIDNVVEGAGKIVDNANSIVEKGVDIADDVVNFERKIKGSIEPSIMDTVNTYVAIVKGVKVFFEKIKDRKNGHHPLVEFRADADANINVYSDDLQEEYDEIDKELNEVRKKLDEMKKH